MKDIIITLDKNHKPIFSESFIGIGLENLQARIIFKFENEFIDGNGELEVSMEGEKGIIQNLLKENNTYSLPVYSSLLTKDHILLQLVIYQANGGIYKSEIAYLKVKDSINATETIPEQYPGWEQKLNMLNDEVEDKLVKVDKAITETNNLNITASKTGNDTSVVITKKTGVTQTVHILDGEQGATGAGITSIEKTSTSGNVDTYTITYGDGDTSTFTVTNGNGIVSIAKTGTSGLVDTYTITFDNGTTTTFTITNGAQGATGEDGRGIVSIAKTGTSGLVDTYTITYTDNTTSTFTVTNGSTPSDSGWIDMVLINGWTTYTTDFQKAQYRKIGNQVFLRGLIKTGTSNNTFCQLPEGYRSSLTDYAAIAHDGGATSLEIRSTGYLFVRTYQTWASLTGVSYFVD